MISRLDFQQTRDIIFDKRITVAAELSGKPEFAHESKLILRQFSVPVFCQTDKSLPSWYAKAMLRDDGYLQ